MKKKFKLDEKLSKIRNELGRTIIAHIGIPESGKFDITGIEFMPCSKNDKGINKKVSSLLNKELRYIG